MYYTLTHSTCVFTKMMVLTAGGIKPPFRQRKTKHSSNHMRKTNWITNEKKKHRCCSLFLCACMTYVHSNQFPLGWPFHRYHQIAQFFFLSFFSCALLFHISPLIVNMSERCSWNWRHTKHNPERLRRLRRVCICGCAMCGKFVIKWSSLRERHWENILNVFDRIYLFIIICFQI